MFGAPLAVKFLDGPNGPDSNLRMICHKVVELGNFSISLLFGIPWASVGGSWRATEMTAGDLERNTNSSLAPDGIPEILTLLERSNDLLLCLCNQSNLAVTYP